MVLVAGLGVLLLALWLERRLEIPGFDMLTAFVAALLGSLLRRCDWLRLREGSRLPVAFVERFGVLRLARRLGLLPEARLFGVLPVLDTVFFGLLPAVRELLLERASLAEAFMRECPPGVFRPWLVEGTGDIALFGVFFGLFLRPSPCELFLPARERNVERDADSFDVLRVTFLQRGMLASILQRAQSPRGAMQKGLVPQQRRRSKSHRT